MKNKSFEEDKKFTRSDFLKMGFAALVGFSAASIMGCQRSPVSGNVPLPQALNFAGDPRTKVYHRPNCWLAPPKSRVVYFDSPHAAENSGYRPCLDCKPRSMRL